MTMPISPRSERPWQPQYFGPLSQLQQPGELGEAILFPGDQAVLGDRLLRERAELVARIQPALDRVADSEEIILYAAPAVEIPSILSQRGLGLLWSSYHQVVIVFTDRRLIEIELGFRGAGLGTRVRSYPWTQVRSLDMKLGRLVLAPGQGRTQRWKAHHARDRELIGSLLAHLREKALALGSSASAASAIEPGVPAARPVPIWHCPNCGSATADYPKSCAICGTAIRQGKTATLLALVFPGAGLLYAGHPILALFDFIGEIALFVIFAFLVISTSGSELWTMVGILSLIFLTKVESVHLATILVKRTKPDEPGASSRWRALLIAGALLTAALLVLPFAFAGRL